MIITGPDLVHILCTGCHSSDRLVSSDMVRENSSLFSGKSLCLVYSVGNVLLRRSCSPRDPTGKENYSESKRYSMDRYRHTILMMKINMMVTTTITDPIEDQTTTMLMTTITNRIDRIEDHKNPSKTHLENQPK